MHVSMISIHTYGHFCLLLLWPSFLPLLDPSLSPFLYGLRPRPIIAPLASVPFSCEGFLSSSSLCISSCLMTQGSPCHGLSPIRGIYPSISISRNSSNVYFSPLIFCKRSIWTRSEAYVDHRQLAASMALFFQSPYAVGSIFWLPRGWALFSLLKAYLSQKLAFHGYQEVNTPLVMKNALWKHSGHWEKFLDNMYSVVPSSSEGTSLAMPSLEIVKPMNCPAHIEIFKRSITSFRELPFRVSEFGTVQRKELHGSLSGLLRLRSFTQDDAHIFCTIDQLFSELTQSVQLIFDVYRTLGFSQISLCLSGKPEIYAGNSQQWASAEKILREALQHLNQTYEEREGEGAFYGPKIDFYVKDIYERQWQCGTIQVDFVIPQRMNATYMNSKGEFVPPVLIHRAILGSVERFLGILIEHYQGNFPLWLSPVQAVICSISHQCEAYALKVLHMLRQASLRIEIDLRNVTLAFKLRNHRNMRTPYLILIGQNEEAQKTVMLRKRGLLNSVAHSLDSLVTVLKAEALPPSSTH